MPGGTMDMTMNDSDATADSQTQTAETTPETTTEQEPMEPTAGVTDDSNPEFNSSANADGDSSGQPDPNSQSNAGSYSLFLHQLFMGMGMPEIAATYSCADDVDNSNFPLGKYGSTIKTAAVIGSSSR
jgi:hypothetical protein